MDSHLMFIFFMFSIFFDRGLLVSGLGCNWGIQATHPLPPNIVVKLMQDNGFNRVKLFEADPRVMRSLGRSGIEVMVGIPNDMLAAMAGSVAAAEEWVSRNVSYYLSNQGVDIRYVAVGNEPFLTTYNNRFTAVTFPALQNIQAALIRAGLGRQVKATLPLNADVYQSENGVPSGGIFRPDIQDLMVSIIRFLENNGAPLTINIYPFLSLNADPNFPINFAFFDGNASPVIDGSITYTNVFDANYDTLISALEKNGFPSIPIIIGEVGWPTDGVSNANLEQARRFNQGLINRINQRIGTPRRPNLPEIYIFSLIDEDAKSVEPGNFERHWGIFFFDGTIKYPLDLGSGRNLTAARGVRYLERQWCVMASNADISDPNLPERINFACSYADCTSLGSGSSCGGMDSRSNASYAFNMYYQTMNQQMGACGQFGNLAVITRIDPSVRYGSCRYEVMIDTGRHEPAPRIPATSSAGDVIIRWAALLGLLILGLIFN